MDELREHSLKSVPQAMPPYGLEQATAKDDAVVKALAAPLGLQLHGGVLVVEVAEAQPKDDKWRRRELPS